eukprot:12643471-Heterocapsa_arctica.AAC.1
MLSLSSSVWRQAEQPQRTQSTRRSAPCRTARPCSTSPPSAPYVHLVAEVVGDGVVAVERVEVVAPQVVAAVVVLRDSHHRHEVPITRYQNQEGRTPLSPPNRFDFRSTRTRSRS